MAQIWESVGSTGLQKEVTGPGSSRFALGEQCGSDEGIRLASRRNLKTPDVPVGCCMLRGTREVLDAWVLFQLYWEQLSRTPVRELYRVNF